MKTGTTLRDEDFNPKPFIKWAGGKRSALVELEARLPKDYNTYHELFLGGGALFFKIKPSRSCLQDINKRLIVTYQCVKKDLSKVIKRLKQHQKNHCKEYYLKSREAFNKEKDPVKLAAGFIYLNRTCFNGLYRVNKQGDFNVPYGKYKRPLILDEENLRATSQLLQKARIKHQSFEAAKPRSKDFYYLDPPYYRTYDQYDKSQFNLNDHKKLAEFCRVLDKKQACFMLSNSDTPEIRKIYKGFKIDQIKVARTISCKVAGRQKEKELIIRNYE